MADEPDEDEMPDASVEAAAGAIADLMKKEQDATAEEEGRDPQPAPEAAKTAAEKPPAADPGLAEAARQQHLSKAQEAEAVRAHYAHALSQLLPQLEHALRGEFSDIRTPAELAQLAQANPERYNRFMALQNQHTRAQEARARFATEEKAAAEERFRSWSDSEVQKVGEVLPELADRQNGPALARKLHDFALKQGYSQEQLRMASATDCAMLFRAMQYHNLEEARDLARARARKAPKVTEPGTRRGAAEGDAEADFARLKKSGSTRDAAAVFRNLIS